VQKVTPDQAAIWGEPFAQLLYQTISDLRYTAANTAAHRQYENALRSHQNVHAQALEQARTLRAVGDLAGARRIVNNYRKCLPKPPPESIRRPSYRQVVLALQAAIVDHAINTMTQEEMSTLRQQVVKVLTTKYPESSLTVAAAV
jgi:ribonuclease D